VDSLGEACHVERLPLCIRAVETLDRNALKRLGRTIHEHIDTELSGEQHRTVINKGIDQELDDLKAVYDGMEEILCTKANEIQLVIPPEIQLEINVTFLPHIGFHIVIPRDEVSGRPVFDGEQVGWTVVFTTPSATYYKDDNMQELDHEVGDIYSAICDMEVEIAHQLAQDVLQDENLLIATSDLLGEIDCALAFAHVAHQYQLVRPQLIEDNMIDIRGGRHLLQEMVVPSFVANDTYIVGGDGQNLTDAPNMILLTGPNYSGKSVYQKQVALAVYMAQMGSFVPAHAASIGITDKILTRITTRETVSKVQSAFMIDLQQIAMALNSCTRRSLVVIDEFGKGTDSCDGAGLAAGVFHHLLSLGVDAPKTLVATHFHEIFDMGVFDDATKISFAHMEVRIDERYDQSASDHNSEITYLYNLRPGRSDLSYGTQCAAMNGVPIEIVERAVDLARLGHAGEDLVSICSAMKDEEMEELRHAEHAARAFLATDFDRNWTQEELRKALSDMLEVTTETSLS
jgi:DNA mismatch repair protein MSH5